MVTQVTVDFSGAVNAAEADSVGTYRLAMPGKKGSFTAKNAKVIKLNSAAYIASLNEVTLTPKKPFALTKPVQVQVNGSPPSGLQDSEGRLIDGNHDGSGGRQRRGRTPPQRRDPECARLELLRSRSNIPGHGRPRARCRGDDQRDVVGRIRQFEAQVRAEFVMPTAHVGERVGHANGRPESRHESF